MRPFARYGKSSWGIVERYFMGRYWGGAKGEALP